MPKSRRALAHMLGVALPLAVAVGIVWAPTWHGPIVLSLSATHGIDTGDLPAVPFLLLAIAVARRGFARSRPPSRAWPALAVVLGLLLLFAGVRPGEGGPLVPAGGTTLDGVIAQTLGSTAVDVDRWSNVALTYDGAAERLYVDGRVVSSRDAKGRIQTPGNPVWIGGNRPYGEHFNGLIDDVRVYDRALSPAEIQRDMTRAAGPAPGLVAAYAFDARSGGTKAVDSSGRGNAGDIHAATWVRGRFGEALRFNGVDSVVRVAPSPSLDLTTAMTLSGWIRPSVQQTGWRAIIQRQTDAYFLSASSGRVTNAGIIEDVRIALVVAAAGWFLFMVATGGGSLTARHRTWWLPVVLFVLGSLADAAFAPERTLIGPLLVALWLAATAARRLEAAGVLVIAATCAGLSIASAANLAAVGDVLWRDHGSIARTATLGALLVVTGVAGAKGKVVRG